MRYVLLLRSEKVSAFAVGRSGFSVPVVFMNNELGQRQFSEYLVERHDALFVVVLDTKDEEHHHEVIPVLKRSDQRKVLKRLLQQYFPGRVLCAANVQNRKYVDGLKLAATITGVNKGNDCDHWLASLQNESALVTEIYSLGLLGASLPMISSTGVTLCAVQVDSNEYRLMAYESARLLISRHVRISGDAKTELSEQLSQTIRYIESISLYSGQRKDDTSKSAELTDTVVDARKFNVVVIGNLSAECRAVLTDDKTNCYQWDQIVEQLDVKFKGELTGAGALFAMLAVNKHNRYALLEMGRYRLSYLSRRVKHLLVAGIVCCLGVTIAAAATTAHYSETYESLTEFAIFLKAGNLEPLPQRFVIDEPEYPIDAVRDSMRLSRQLEVNAQFTPFHFLSDLAVDLTVYPELQVTAIKWSRSEVGKTTNFQLPTRMEMLPDLFGESYTATIEGFVRAGQTEALGLSGRFNSFIAALKATNRYTSVTVIESPFAIDRDIFTSSTPLASQKQRFLVELINQDVVR